MRARALLALARPGRRGAAALGVVGGAGMSGLYLRGADSEFHSISDCEDLLPLTYEPERFEAVWREHPRVTAARLLEIGAGVTPLVARLAADATINALRNALGRAEAPQEAERRQKARASELRTLLTSLGPTFIKMGQMLSIRPDVLPPAAIYELQKLCDAVPSYPTAKALQLIESELGRPVSEVFDGLDAGTEPIAAASLGQVYRCRLKDTGEEIALKVQRPDMIRAVSLDLYLLRQYMKVKPPPLHTPTPHPYTPPPPHTPHL